MPLIIVDPATARRVLNGQKMTPAELFEGSTVADGDSRREERGSEAADHRSVELYGILGPDKELVAVVERGASRINYRLVMS